MTELWRSTGGADSVSSGTAVMTESEDFSKPSVAHLQDAHSLKQFKNSKGTH